ncbi:PREDICTED: putative F-box/kelch-repeat protein At3g24610 [Camelina sativa]|uniref:F-box/kelch-repeat protein At3g24610 n=1 Tax=Camelina sativa TaxID=90675 RepID=A0ABM0TDB9_CAMSA|nr:PREDICTED: putative F-box/kelch-repeat protein At3g24610 [Camelina sativa]
MRVARSSAAANVVDGRIYVFGGCNEVDFSDWAEVFDPKTQSWDTLPMPEDPEIRKNRRKIEKSVVMEDKVYAVDQENQSFYYLPSEGIWRRGNRDSMRGNRNGWCAIGKLLYCCASRWRILWCDPEGLDWKEVKGLDVDRWLAKNSDISKLKQLDMTSNGFSRMSCNSRGNIVVFWLVPLPDYEMELWCAEISLERHEGGEIWGKIVWEDVVFELDTDLSYTMKVLYSVSVNL